MREPGKAILSFVGCRQVDFYRYDTGCGIVESIRGRMYSAADTAAEWRIDKRKAEVLLR